MFEILYYLLLGVIAIACWPVLVGFIIILGIAVLIGWIQTKLDK